MLSRYRNTYPMRAPAVSGTPAGEAAAFRVVFVSDGCGYFSDRYPARLNSDNIATATMKFTLNHRFSYL